MFSADDHRFMSHALALAALGRYTTAPNPCVGAVLVRDGQIVGEGWHPKAGAPHAEVFALRQAGSNARGATAYVTLEPCSHHGRTPPCAQALIDAGVTRVVAAMIDPNPLVAGRGLHLLSEAGITADFGLLASEAEALNTGFFKRMRSGFPRVTVKMGASLDGRTALSNGESQWITGAPARSDVQRLRAGACVVLSSAQTVIMDNASLTVRWAQLPASVQAEYPAASVRQPLRVIVDRHNRVTPDLALFNAEHSHSPILLARHQAAGDFPHWVTQLEVPLLDDQLDLVSLFMLLAKRGINNVLVEAGATLCGALLSKGLVD
ncbi:MAG: bifunctional diaminohydroxyphosphoribosylaminopyrimidine deaminase/5-amino-6-(5-phosphoribosylamino)uracil reductase RibD, partial [Aeromonas sp.]